MRRFLPAALLAALIGFSACADAQSAAPAETGKSEAAPDSLDKLYARLAKTQFAEEAQGILADFDALRMHSGSDTADLLLARALQARTAADFDVALPLFDAVVDLYPDWSEGWSERATARFQNGDVNGAMGDLAQTLKREPRDVGALAGVGSILLDAGDSEAALRVYDRALALAPAYEPLQEARARAQNSVWSRSP